MGQALLLATLVFVTIRLRSLWERNHVDFAQIAWPTLALGAIVTTAGIAGTGFVWIAIVRRLGVPARHRSSAILFQAQLSKYIPGAVWQYAGRAALAQSHGIPVGPVALSLPIEIGASLCAAAALAPLLLGPWGIPATLALLFGIRFGAKRISTTGGRARTALAVGGGVVPLFALIWLMIGLGFWLTARALVGVPAGDVFVYVGAFAAAWAVGLLAIYAPGGLGVREALLVVLLHARLSSADALVVAGAFRALLTLIDVAAAGVAVLVLRDRRLAATDTSTSAA